MSGIEYFAETYCKIKNEMGQVKNIRLRDYQKEILNMFINNGESILLASRQVGKCFDFNTTINIDGNEIEIYKIWFKHSDKKIIDYVKFYIYSLINYLN